MPSPKPQTVNEEDELAELPPLDGGEDDAPEGEAGWDGDEPDAGDEGDPFDDREAGAEGDGAEHLELGGPEGGWLEGADEADKLEVGADDLLAEEEDLLEGNEAPGTGDEDYGLGGDESSVDVDAGEEGPGDDDEELKEEDLPRLDADEGGSPDDADFIEEGFGAEEGALGLPWAPEGAWERVGAPVELGSMRTVARVARGALAGGAGLVRIDLEGDVQPLAAMGLSGGDITRLWPAGQVVVATTEEGRLFVSRDGGASFSPRAAGRPQPGVGGAVAGDVVFTEGELWMRTGLGALVFSADLGESWETVDAGGFVAAIGADDAGRVVALVRGLRGAALVRGRRASLVQQVLPGGLADGEGGGQIQIVARGSEVAVACEGRPVSVSVDGGVSWASSPGTETATALAWAQEEGTLVVGLWSSRQERAWLARVSPRGEARLIGEVTLPPEGGEGGVLAIAYDETLGVVWVAGAFGVAAWQPKGG